MKIQSFHPNKESGISLIEVLVAVLILAFGLLGLASLQMVTLKNNQSSFDRSRAIMAVYSIADVMRADMGSKGELNTSSGFVTAQQTNWTTLLQQHLGDDADGQIQCVPSTITPLGHLPITKHICTVTITWDDSLGLMGENAYSLVTQVQL